MTDAFTHDDVVRVEWIDDNDHLSGPYYVLVFGDATTAFMDHVGLDDAHRVATGCSLCTVEAHVRYLHEVGPDATLHVHTRALGRDATRLRLWHELHVDGRLVGTEELLGLHVGPDGTLPFPEAVATRLDAAGAGSGTSSPDGAGRSLHAR